MNEHPHLRLAAGDDVTWRRAREVTSENRAAAAHVELDPTDPRWVLAVRTHAQLQGAMLTPERRRRVMRTAEVLGVRPFEANVIIAVVQHTARMGRPLGDAVPTLAVVPGVERRGPGPMLLYAFAALATALAVAAVVIRWLIG